MSPPIDAQTEVRFKVAEEADLNILTGLIHKYYEFDEIPFNEGEIRSGLPDLLKNDALGLIWLILQQHKPIGYVILTFAFDLEVGGRLAAITDLYLEPEYRRKGIGRQTLQHVEDFCRRSGIHSLELQVERDNAEAMALYKTFGFEAHDRIPMSKRLR